MISKCVKCDGTSFRIQEQEPTGSNVKLMFVQCAKCATPAGVVDYYPNGPILRKVEALEKAIKKLEGDIGSIDYLVRQLAHRVK
jgi:hypothetical protein